MSNIDEDNSHQGRSAPNESPNQNRELVVSMAVAVEGGLVVIALCVGWLFNQPPLSKFSLSLSGFAWGLLATLPMFAAFLLMYRWPVGPLARIKSFGQKIIRPFMQPCTRVDLFAICCLAGLGEEMLFRGWMQDLMVSGGVGPVWAILLASLLFGLVHAITPTYAILATLVGMYLGWIYVITDNLLVPTTAHALYDFVALWIVVRDPFSAELPEDPAKLHPPVE